MTHIKFLSVMMTVVLAPALAFAASGPKTTKLEKTLRGNWKLVSMSCKGVDQKLEMDYSLSFEGGKGAYVSKTGKCTQIEPELYTYTSEKTVAIKQGVRVCNPNPCDADLPAAQCGKETNPLLPQYDVAFDKDGMVLTTNDPNAIDCTGPGQAKPAVFHFTKIKKK